VADTPSISVIVLTAWGDEPCRGTHAGAHATLRRCRRDVASLSQQAGTLLAGLSEDQGGMPLGTGAPRIADAAELHIEVLLGHETHLELA
jgi:hypothetical protein